MEESIKEMNLHLSREGRSLPCRACQETRVGRLIKDMWPAYLIEIIVIILGISITLALRNGVINQRKSPEQIYRKFSDVETDQKLKNASSEQKNA
jgi:hypothetical protein